MKKPKPNPRTKAHRTRSMGSKTQSVWTGNDDLRPLLVPIESLTPDPRNARKHSKNQIDRVCAMLKRFGQQKPIVTNAEGMIGAGNGLYECAKLLGWTHIARTRSNLPPAEFKAFSLADNIASDLAQWETGLFQELVDEVERETGDLSTAGLDLSEDELADIMADAEKEIDRNQTGHPNSDSLDLGLPPPTIHENINELQDIADGNREAVKAQRRKGNEATASKHDTERYLVIVFKDRASRETLVKQLGLPTDERYVAAESVRISAKRDVKPLASSDRPIKAATPAKSGAQG